MIRGILVCGMTAAVLATTACASPSSSSTTSPVPTSTPQPARPATISMTGLDPCSVLTDGQIAQLGVKFVTKYDDPPSPTTGNVRACSWVSGGYETHTTVYVQGVTYRGLDDVRADPSAPQTEFYLHGFRAVTRDNSAGFTDPSCEVFVDVADGQTFETAYVVDSTDPALACRRAKQAADFGMTYLLDR